MNDPREALEILLQLTRQLTEELPLEDKLQSVTDAALLLLPADHASVRLLDETGTLLISQARSGAGRPHQPLPFRPGQGLAGWAVENSAVARVPDTREDPRFQARPGQGFDVRAIMVVPLWSGGQVVGVLAVSSSTPSAFDDDDELLARLLSNCAAPAFEQARLERLAITDPHTRAFNRRYMVPRLEEEMARSKRSGSPLSLLLMDLDHFKRVNDEYGHAEGDRVLRAFADRVRLETRRQDALVRWGGEEFVLIMPDTPAEDALHVAERIRAGVAGRAIPLGAGGELAQTVSIGVATWDGAESPQALEERADAAMYEAKRAGRNRVHAA